VKKTWYKNREIIWTQEIENNVNMGALQKEELHNLQASPNAIIIIK
jgi:hypothetical protein